MKRLVILLLLAIPPLVAQAPLPSPINGSGGAGSITSIAPGCGLSTSPNPIVATGTVLASEVPRLNTSTTDAILTGDCGNLVTNTNVAAIAASIAACGSTGFAAGWFVEIQNRGAGTYTLTPTTSGVDGAASIDLLTDQGIRLTCGADNQYYTERGRGLMTGPGTVAGEYKMYELATNGSNYYSFRAPNSRATNLIELQPTADPTAGQTKLYSAPSSTISTVTWGTPLVSGATTAFTFGGGGSIAPGSGVVTSNFWQNFNTCTATGVSPLSCGATNGGLVTIAAGATSAVINNSFVTNQNQIHLQFVSSTLLGTRLGVTCNTTPPVYWESDRVSSTSFTISVAAAPVANPACFTYTILN